MHYPGLLEIQSGFIETGCIPCFKRFVVAALSGKAKPGLRNYKLLLVFVAD